MSIRVMSLVWDKFQRGGSEKLVMLAMADWCNDEGGSLHPSIAKVAKKVCLSEKQTRVIIHKLIDEGYFTVVGNAFGGDKGQTRKYVLNIEKLSSTPVGVTPPVEVTPPVDEPYPSRARSFTPPVEVSQTINDPLIEPSISGKMKKPLEVPDFIDKELFESFLIFRHSIKAKNSEIAIKALITKMKRLHDEGNDLEEVINQSIRASWKDVYPVKRNLSQRHSTSREQGRSIAAASIFTPENTRHLQGNIKTVEGSHEPVKQVGH